MRCGVQSLPNASGTPAPGCSSGSFVMRASIFRPPTALAYGSSDIRRCRINHNSFRARDADGGAA
ncbi:hypothetical protein Misp02_60140 [Microtetraspora sp. NBRC 16547]|nr:hypothetical protein Misp02_60140 [Microtetraspora sp. NBRC 16547]